MRVADDSYGWLMENAEVGDDFADGLTTLTFDTDEEVVIERITTLGGEDHLEQLGALIAGDDRRFGSIQRAEHFPPRSPAFGELLPAEGRSIPARPGKRPNWHLVIGYKVTSRGVAFRRGLEIVYSTGGRTYAAILPAELLVCTRDVRDCKIAANQYIEPAPS